MKNQDGKRYCPDCYNPVRHYKHQKDTYICTQCNERFDARVTLSQYQLEGIVEATKQGEIKEDGR